MSMFQRRHYKKIAAVMAYANADKLMLLHMCGMFRSDNHRFDEERFLNEVKTIKAFSGNSGI